MTHYPHPYDLATLTQGQAAELWLRYGLESGAYPQGMLQLYNPAIGYCCLGVGGDMFHADGLPKKIWGDAHAPEWFMAAIGMKDDMGASEYGDLSSMNDSGATFAEIAAHIRAHPGAYCAVPEPLPEIGEEME